MGIKLKVAAIQLKNYIGEPNNSRNESEKLIKQAAKEGAKLITLPELSACGYIPNDEIWNYGETINGPTATWACSLAKELGIYLGVGFLEIEGENFFNSYLLAGPKGIIEGVIRKINTEAYCFKSGDTGVYIDTDIGRIGIGICADNHLYTFFRRVKEANVDIMLMPHAWATPYKTNKYVKQEDIDNAITYAEQLAFTYTRHLSIPTVFINPVGEFPPMPGVLGKFMSPENFRLQGGSQIVDGNHVFKMQTKTEGFIVAEVELGNTTSVTDPPIYNGWLHPGSSLVRKIIIPYDVWKGRKYYKKSKERKEKAKLGQKNSNN